VAILEMAPRRLGNFDPDQVKILLVFRKRSAWSFTSAPMKSVEKTAAGYLVRAGSDGEQTFESASGGPRRGPGPERGGPGTRSGRPWIIPGAALLVNDWLQSVSNPRFTRWATWRPRPALTPVATRPARPRPKHHPRQWKKRWSSRPSPAPSSPIRPWPPWA
jgi:hypothetical protein